jgi:fluoride exporter
MIWYIALGSAVGGASRFLLGALIQQKAGTTFPVATLLINISGSLVLGLVLRYAIATPAITPEVRALLTTGFCGGYTTFSTFSYETATLLEDGDYARAALYVISSVLASVLGTFAGFALAREILDVRRHL